MCTLTPRRYALALPVFVLLASACSVAPEPANGAASDDSIRDGHAFAVGNLAPVSTLSFGYCTGVLITPRHALTAAHCTVSPGDHVDFYRSDGFVAGAPAEVESTVIPAGVDVARARWEDALGRFADLRVVTLKEAIRDPSVKPAELPTVGATPLYGGEPVWAVGGGMHDGVANPDQHLLWREARIADYSASMAWFVVRPHLTDSGDSGGPLYANALGAQDRLRVLGILHGGIGDASRYTSVLDHLPWIQSQIISP